MKRIFFCVSLVLTGLMSSCVEKYEEVDAESKPEWLGSSIYSELENPSEAAGLQGTFSTYLRLINDLGQADVLKRTGSKTVFPANDEAFNRFFESDNVWKVKSYEQLSYAQKVLLLKSSMLDNPLLLQMLPNMSNGTVEAVSGQALKHATNVAVSDSVQIMKGKDDMPKNNPFWEKFYNQDISIVSVASTPMMVHLTREYMINNSITMNGDDSDFALITGNPYPEGSRTAYIFNNKVIVPDVTCQNGYIHQMDNVLVPPGNMAQVLRNRENLSLMSRMLDYFALPIFSDAVTKDYNSWARENNRQQKDAIYTMRYMSSRSYNYDNYVNNQEPVVEALANKKIDDVMITNYLGFDPGWNGYYPAVVNAGGRNVEIMDMASFFVPNDQAVRDYFLPSTGDPNKGHGAFLIDIYGDPSLSNTAENLPTHLDSLHVKNPQIVTSLLKNLMKASFVESVPSKFESVLNDASENMGLTIDLIAKKDDGKRDIVMANNGAVYVLNEMIAPDEFQAVLAPATFYQDMKVMNWAIQDRGSTDYHLGLDFKFYLLAMKANYAFFIPEDSAFNYYYLDPATLGHRENNTPNGALRPDVLHFFYKDDGQAPTLKCERMKFDMESGQPDESTRATEKIANVKSQLVDLLNYHTVVLKEGQDISSNHYFKTKHGGEIYVDGPNKEGTKAMSGAQIDLTYFDVMGNQQKGRTFTIQGLDAPTITQVYPEKNGYAYRLNRVIQAPVQSVYGVLKGTVLNGDTVFSKFLNACTDLSQADVLDWAGISQAQKETGGTEQDAYKVFVSDYKLGTKSIANACLDYNVKMFNTYNYTLFAPDNAAMDLAYERGLPKWESDDASEETISKLYMDYQQKVQQWAEDNDKDPKDYEDDATDTANKAKAKKMIKAIRDFIRFHFVTNSVYADQSVDGGRMKTLSSDDMGVAKEIRISGGSGVLTVTDRESSHQVSVNAADSGSKVVNKMTRDYWFDNSKLHAKSIETSSFCAVHQISEPLCADKNGRYDNQLSASRRGR